MSSLVAMFSRRRESALDSGLLDITGERGFLSGDLYLRLGEGNLSLDVDLSLNVWALRSRDDLSLDPDLFLLFLLLCSNVGTGLLLDELLLVTTDLEAKLDNPLFSSSIGSSLGNWVVATDVLLIDDDLGLVTTCLKSLELNESLFSNTIDSSLGS